jgi:hypothetical protein
MLAMFSSGIYLVTPYATAPPTATPASAPVLEYFFVVVLLGDLPLSMPPTPLCFLGGTVYFCKMGEYLPLGEGEPMIFEFS